MKLVLTSENSSKCSCQILNWACKCYKYMEILADWSCASCAKSQNFRGNHRYLLNSWSRLIYIFLDVATLPMLIQPYLQRFTELNPGSTVKYETDVGCNIEQVFIGLSIMKTTIRYVRPILYLDVTHIKSQWKGTLYSATVKTACDKLYVVAFAIMRDNENEDGWTWILENLHSAVEILVMDHPRTTKKEGSICKTYCPISGSLRLAGGYWPTT